MNGGFRIINEGHRRKEEHKKKGNGYFLFNENSEHTNTLSARYYKDGSEILIDQGAGKLPRKLTPRECARLQGFPDSFIIPVSDTRAYKQFGNSVAVPVIRRIAENMLAEMYRMERELNNNLRRPRVKPEAFLTFCLLILFIR